MFIWRSNLLGSSGKGHEYMLKYLLGTKNGLQGKDLGETGGVKPQEVKWHDEAREGKLDLLVTLDFRMSTTCLYSDIVLPTATWYEKDDLNTSDMHPFIHPLTAATDPAWEARSDWEIYKGIAKAFSRASVGHLGVEKDVVTLPLLHDAPAELGQPFDVKDWKKGECELIPGKTAPNFITVERDYPNTYARFTSVGPLLDKLGNGGKGINWDTKKEVNFLRQLNYQHMRGRQRRASRRSRRAIDAAEMILTLAPETNGQVAVKAWQALSEITGLDHTHLATNKEEEKIRFRDVVAQPRKIISSPTWSGLEDEHVSYNAGYTNVHELIPWRTLTGRQQFYQDHEWMRAFGESLLVYRPPIDTKASTPMLGAKPTALTRESDELDHAAPEVGHSQHLQRKPADADAVPGRPHRVDERGRRPGTGHRGQRLDRAVQPQRRANGPGRGQSAGHAEHGDDVPRPGAPGEHSRFGNHRYPRRHPQLGHPGLPQTDPYDRRLRPVFLRVQLLRHRRLQPRRVCRGAQDEQRRLAGRRRPGRSTGGREMKIRSQVGMVLNLDKCIGCHTCSVTCKNVWTSREGMEYAWFNNVETKPGIGYPKEWENQDKWKGGWLRDSNGKHPAAHRRPLPGAGEHLRQPGPAGDRRLLRAVRLRLPAPAHRR